jgi:hypothetical protein
MGPILLLDKSTFQSLSRDELRTMRAHFMEALPPILVHEIVGDLSLELQAGASAEEKVAELAAKFGGSGPATMWDYRTLCSGSLRGNDPPMDGRIPARMGVPVPDPDGEGYGMFIDLAPENHALLRWARGEFSADEHQAATAWRAEAVELSIAPLQQRLHERHVIFPRCTSVAEVVHAAEELLGTVALQGVWIEWLLDSLEASEPVRQQVRLRFRTRPQLLSRFAPYANYCARALLAFLIARHFRLVTERPTDLRDIQYLYYAPFCQAFGSNDRLHKALAPHLLRPDQMFVAGEELKADLRRLRASWDGLDEAARDRRIFAFGSYPVPATDSIVCKIWGRFCRPWGPGMGNRAGAPSAEDQRTATDEARQLFHDAALGFDYAPLTTP